MQTVPSTDGAPVHPATRLTRAFLSCGIVAAPLYFIVALIQAFIRPGFDLTRHQLSLLSNGALGWLQITNSLMTGLLFLACAVGMWRVLHGGRGGTWGPLLVGTFGVGLIASGIFLPDPAQGFPPGTQTSPNFISWHALVHFIVGGLAFLALIAACLVLTRRFAAQHRWGWAAYSGASGVLFMAAFAGLASGSRQAWINPVFVAAALLAFGWVSVMAARLLTQHV